MRPSSLLQFEATPRDRLLLDYELSCRVSEALEEDAEQNDSSRYAEQMQKAYGEADDAAAVKSFLAPVPTPVMPVG